MVAIDKLIRVAKDELVGELFIWGKPTGKIGELPAGQYFQQPDGMLITASEDMPGQYTPSTKESYRLINFEQKKADIVQKPLVGSRPIRYKVVSTYQRYWTLITVAGTPDGQTKPTLFLQCRLSGHYRDEQAKNLWEREPQRFKAINVNDLDSRTRRAFA